MGLTYDEVQRIVRDLDTQEQIDAFLASWEPPDDDPILPALLAAQPDEDSLAEALVLFTGAGIVLLAIAATGRYNVLQVEVPDGWADLVAYDRRFRARRGIDLAEQRTIDPDQLAAYRGQIDEYYKNVTRGHATALTQGDIDLAEYQRRMTGSIVEAHTVQRRLGQGGIDDTARRSLQDTLDEQLGYFEELLGQIEDGRLSSAQIVDRSGRYGANGGMSFNEGMSAATAAIAVSEQRFLGACTPHCAECVEYAARGPQPVGTLPLPRQRCSCRSSCCCVLQRFDLSGSVVGWIG